MRVLFIIPCFNAEKNLDTLTKSLISQNDDRWFAVFVDDISKDETWKKMQFLRNNDVRFHCIKNSEKKYALKNIIETSRLFQDRDDVIIAIIDGDDSLCNNDTVSLLIKEYESKKDVVWTAHKWDINGMNISYNIPASVNPYFWPWCTSHLKTFRSSLVKDIHDKNFKDTDKNWFKRGYDQALMLPILHKTKNRKFIDKVCYLYNINSVSMETRSWEEKDQISTINIVRARGFLD